MGGDRLSAPGRRAVIALTAASMACGSSSTESRRGPQGTDGGGGGIVQPPEGMTVTLTTANEYGEAVANAEFVFRDAAGGYFMERTGADGTFVAKYVRPPYDVVAITKVGRRAFIGLEQANVRLPVYARPAELSPPPKPNRRMTQAFNVLLPECGTSACPMQISTRTRGGGVGDTDDLLGTPGSTYPTFVSHSWFGDTKVDGDARLLVSDANCSRYWYDRRPLSFTDGANAPSLDWRPLPIENAGQLTVSANMPDIPGHWRRSVGASLAHPDEQGGGIPVSRAWLARSSAMAITMGVPKIVGATLEAFAWYESPEQGPPPSFKERARARRSNLALITASVQLMVIRPPDFIHPARGERLSAMTDWSWQTFTGEGTLAQISVASEASEQPVVIYTRKTALSIDDLHFIGVDRSPGRYSLSVQVEYPASKLDDVLSLENTRYGFKIPPGDSYAMSSHEFTIEP